MPRKASQQVVMVVQQPKKKKKAAPKSGAMVKYIKGSGDYVYGDTKNMGPFETAGRFVGRALGSTYGKTAGKLGEKIGSYLHYIGKIFGSGDYVTSAQSVRSNSLVNSSQIPSFAHGKSSVKIQHREFLGDIISSSVPGAFQLQDYPINPGMQQTFPWLSEVVGGNFQQYRINGMVFEFRSMSGDALTSSNTALGSVIMATDYDSTDQRFTSKQQMENTEFGVSCKPASCMIHAIECARSQTSINEQYVRFGAVPNNADIRLYDLGRFSIATVGVQGASVNLGELWVSYSIELFKPIQLPPLATAGVAHYELDTTATLNNHPIAVKQPALIDTIGLTFDAPAPLGNILYFPLDMKVDTKFMIVLTWTGTEAASVVPSATLAGGLAIIEYFNNPLPADSGSERLCQILVVGYKGGGTVAVPPSITYSACVGPSPITHGDLYVCEVNGNLV